MYPSNYSWNWNSKDLGPNRDLLGDLKTSFTKIAPEIRFGLYYSLYEWFHSLYLKDKSSKWKAQEYVNVCIIDTKFRHMGKKSSSNKVHAAFNKIQITPLCNPILF